MSIRLLRPGVYLSLLICATASAKAQAQPAISASFVDIKAAGVTVRGYLAKPTAGSALPAVLLVPAMGDLKRAVLETARDMAAHGFVALAVDYDPEHVSQQSDLVQSIGEEQLSARLQAAVEWLARQRPQVDPQRIGAIGFDEASARILKLAQQGHIHAGVVVESERCAVPENLPAMSAAPILLVLGGCTQERGREMKVSLEAGGAYRVAIAPAWPETYKFLSEASVAPTRPISSNLVATIRDIMRVINSDDGVKGKLARMLTASSNGGVQWDQARSHAAILVDSCEWLAALRPAKGSISGWRGHVADFRAATQTLLNSIEKQDLPSAQQALGRLPQSCGSCHSEHR